MKTLISDFCPAGSVDELAGLITAFRNSPAADLTFQKKHGHPDAPYCLEFTKERIQALIDDPTCEGVRIYFAGEATGKDVLSASGPGHLSLVLVAYNAAPSAPSELQDKAVAEVHNLMAVNNNSPAFTLDCCGHNVVDPLPDGTL